MKDLLERDSLSKFSEFSSDGVLTEFEDEKTWICVSHCIRTCLLSLNYYQCGEECDGRNPSSEESCKLCKHRRCKNCMFEKDIIPVEGSCEHSWISDPLPLQEGEWLWICVSNMMPVRFSHLTRF